MANLSGKCKLGVCVERGGRGMGCWVGVVIKLCNSKKGIQLE